MYMYMYMQIPREEQMIYGPTIEWVQGPRWRWQLLHVNTMAVLEG